MCRRHGRAPRLSTLHEELIMLTTKNRNRHSILAASMRALVLASLGLAAAACGMPDDENPFAAETETETAALTSGQLMYDNINYNGTIQIWDTVATHTCPEGWAMQGNYGDTWFKCRKFTPAGGRFFDHYTQGTYTPPYGWYGYNWSYTTMHACPTGSVMVGQNTGKNLLVCEPFTPTAGYSSSVYRDDASQDKETGTVTINKPPVMHVCGENQQDDLMVGIHAGQNKLGCIHETIILPGPH
jgi:hypothetical protein